MEKMRAYWRLTWAFALVWVGAACGEGRTPVPNVFATEQAKVDATRESYRHTQAALGRCLPKESLSAMATVEAMGPDVATSVAVIREILTATPVPYCDDPEVISTATLEP